MEKATKINQLSLKIFFFLALNDLLDTSAQLLMKKGVHHLFAFADHDFLLFWTGAVLYLFNFFLWMTILAELDLSIALPLASAGYILIPIAAVFILHESVSPVRWLGLISIVIGIYFVSQSKPSEANGE